TNVKGGSMSPAEARDSSTLDAGGIFQLNRNVIASYEVDHFGALTVAHESVFDCKAAVDVVTPPVPVACALSPSSANVTVSGIQDFSVTCYSKKGAVIQCPSLDWTTNVTGGSMNPLSSDTSSTLTAGSVVENNRNVKAAANASAIVSFECDAVVNVTPVPEPAVSCSLSPSDADVPVSGTQDFTPTCLGASGNATQCPMLFWTTDVDGGYMSPFQTPGVSTLYAGTIAENGKYVKAASDYDTTVPGYFECNSSVDIVPPLPQAASCSLLPSSANVPAGGSQYFMVSCLDQYGSAIACPALDWSTDVTGGIMNPTQSNNGSTLTAGGVVQSDRYVFAMDFDDNFSCTASVNVTPASQPYCVLNPLAANVPIFGTQPFSISCYNASGSAIACDNMSWTTSVTGGSMSPLSSPSGSTLTAGGAVESGKLVAASSPNYNCNATVNVVNYSATSCALAPSNVSVGRNGTVLFVASCSGSGGSVSCPALAWSTDVTGGWMDPLQSLSSSTLHAGTTPETGRHVVATAPGLAFSCSADVTVVDSDAVSCALSPSAPSIVVTGSQSFYASCYRGDGSSITCPTLSWTTDVPGASLNPSQSISTTVLYANVVGTGVLNASTSWFVCGANVSVVNGIPFVPGGGGYYYYGPYGPTPIPTPGTGSFSPAPSATPRPTATAKVASPTPVRGTYHTPWTPPQLTPTASPNANAGGLTGLFTAFAPGSWLEILIAILALGGSAFLVRKMAAGA
ncbi:MAG: hypothetical protein V1881_00840, partial [Candidatus Micrarchaeota archaeon]